MTPEDSLALLRLVAIGGPIWTRRTLLESCSGPAAALDAADADGRACGLVPDQVQALRRIDDPAVDAARCWLEDPRHRLVGWTDDDYPPQLRRSTNPPLALFVAGDADLLWHPSVAIVGSRAATPAGVENAATFARTLAGSGLGVASGLAAGIDTAAHAAALGVEGGRTFAVVGTGPDVVYPRSNAALHERMTRVGAVVSEYLPGTQPRPEHFPSRNRILAALTLGTVVIEAAHRSGALITARLAAEAGHEVFAVPGSIHNPMTRGCHRLIRDGATLVEDATELIAALAPQAQQLATDLRLRLAGPIYVDAAKSGRGSEAPARHEAANDRDYQSLWGALGHDPTGMDQLVERTGLTPAMVSSMLLLMELDGRVATQHGRYYRTG
ncbi:DNA-processing protein DprA [Agrilutibacter solisilvae]|uniref:DNA-processing protein DprA n=1 Tax=Agrilutibacter solisilvae TaxID=2763317 RepID=A0A974XZU6_9GAMM|nr:DNA-processing protein DprA [Lysobacter solisilvae]QSX78807.1 DNA-processing protein DprA [Lysobacter solisilvae]